MKQEKRGISLIVLVITIIVMIILATAIILSLNSSNISGKASEAKLTSDLSNKKEAASVYVAEYELKVAKGKIDKSTTTVDTYVKGEMKKAGIDTSDVAVQDDGTILVGIAAMFVNNNIAVGTKVEGYKLNNVTTYTTSGKENPSNTNKIVTRDENITWKYMGIDSNGEVLIVGSVTSNSPTMTLGGKGGFVNGPQELNNACEALYSSSMGMARSINIDDLMSVLEYTGERGSYYDLNGEYKGTFDKVKTINEIAKEIGYDMDNFKSLTPEEGKSIGTYKSDYYSIPKYSGEDDKIVKLIYPGNDDTLTGLYWFSSSCVVANFKNGYATFYVYYMNSGYVISSDLFTSKGGYDDYIRGIRPVVSLNPSVQMAYENGVVKLK